jgi:hypothetical protein
MPSATPRPPLWFVQVSGFEDMPASNLEPVQVAGPDEAIRVAEGRFCWRFVRQQAGNAWWLVPTWTAAAARREAGFLSLRRHGRQADFDVAHQAIRCGLEPDLGPLYDLDPAAHRRRDSPLFVTPT